MIDKCLHIEPVQLLITVVNIGSIRCTSTIEDIQLHEKVKLHVTVYGENGAILLLDNLEQEKVRCNVTNGDILHVAQGSLEKRHIDKIP